MDETKFSAPTPELTAQGPRGPGRIYCPGDLIADRYKLLRCLGQGGMGEVWAAQNQSIETEVALKFIRKTTPGEQLADRLLREARAAARLSEPGIVRVFDFGQDRDNPFIVMELLQGRSLSTLLREQGRVNPEDALRILLPIFRATISAHAAGIVHRDIKPANIFLAEQPDGTIQPKLLDFGIAKLQVGEEQKLTQSGVVLGSAAYMSPEQASGKACDQRTDIWALTLVLYELLTSQCPFERENYNATLYAVISESPPAIASLGVGDDDLSTIVAKGMAKNPDERWITCRDLGQALAGWLLGKGVEEDITGASLRAAWFQRPRKVSSASVPVLSTPPRALSREGRPPSAEGARRRRTILSWAALAAGALVAAGFIGYRAHPPRDLPHEAPLLQEATHRAPHEATHEAPREATPPPQAVSSPPGSQRSPSATSAAAAGGAGGFGASAETDKPAAGSPPSSTGARSRSSGAGARPSQSRLRSPSTAPRTSAPSPAPAATEAPAAPREEPPRNPTGSPEGPGDFRNPFE